MALGGAASVVASLGLAAILAFGEMAVGQPQPPVQAVTSITAEEKTAAERAAIVDPRMRAIVGTETLRVATSDVELDKEETKSFLAGTSERPPGRRVTVVALSMRTNKAARALVSVPDNRVLEVEVAKITAAADKLLVF